MVDVEVVLDAVTKRDQLALLAARQVEIAHQPLARVIVTVPFVVHTLAAALPTVSVTSEIAQPPLR